MRNSHFIGYFTYLLPVLLLFLYGCIMVPKAVEDRNASCQLSTRKFTLDVYSSAEVDSEQLVRELTRLSTTKCDDASCLLVMAPVITVSAGFVIVSGSLVIIGNTIHWLEKEGKCDDGVINQAVTGIRDVAVDAGGWVVETTGDLIDFFSDAFNG